jgi:hypothetical protein
LRKAHCVEDALDVERMVKQADAAKNLQVQNVRSRFKQGFALLSADAEVVMTAGFTLPAPTKLLITKLYIGSLLDTPEQWLQCLWPEKPASDAPWSPLKPMFHTLLPDDEDLKGDELTLFQEAFEGAVFGDAMFVVLSQTNVKSEGDKLELVFSAFLEKFNDRDGSGLAESLLNMMMPTVRAIKALFAVYCHVPGKHSATKSDVAFLFPTDKVEQAATSKLDRV